MNRYTQSSAAAQEPASQRSAYREKGHQRSQGIGYPFVPLEWPHRDNAAMRQGGHLQQQDEAIESGSSQDYRRASVQASGPSFVCNAVYDLHIFWNFRLDMETPPICEVIPDTDLATLRYHISSIGDPSYNPYEKWLRSL